MCSAESIVWCTVISKKGPLYPFNFPVKFIKLVIQLWTKSHLKCKHLRLWSFMNSLSLYYCLLLCASHAHKTLTYTPWGWPMTQDRANFFRTGASSLQCDAYTSDQYKVLLTYPQIMRAQWWGWKWCKSYATSLSPDCNSNENLWEILDQGVR